MAAVERKEGQAASRLNDLTARRREEFVFWCACVYDAREVPCVNLAGSCGAVGFVGLGADSHSVTVATKSDVRGLFYFYFIYTIEFL